MFGRIPKNKSVDGRKADQIRPGKDGEAGFSIIEIMIGVVVLSFGVMAICSMQMSGIRGNSAARQYTDTSTICMDKIEELMSLPYGSPELIDTDGDADDAVGQGLFHATIASADHFETDPSGQYTIFWNVAENDLMVRTKTVSVIIVWTGAGMQRNVSMQRVIPEII